MATGKKATELVDEALRAVDAGNYTAAFTALTNVAAG